MQPNFPTFQQSYLHSVRICACFQLGNSPLAILLGKLKGQEAIRGIRKETKFETKSGSAWIRIRATRKLDTENSGIPDVRLLIESALESLFPPSRSTLSPPNTAEEVQELLKIFSKEKVIVTCCEGLFKIPLNKIPKRSLVGMMMDISASVGEADMNLTGATFDIQGHAPYEELKWERKTTSGDNGTDLEEVDVTISASPEIEGIGGNPDQVADVLFSGIQELVLEKGK